MDPAAFQALIDSIISSGGDAAEQLKELKKAFDYYKASSASALNLSISIFHFSFSNSG